MMYIKNIHLVVFSIFLMIGNTISYGQSITVNSTNYKQTIDMIGGDMERSSSAIQSATNKNDILQWSFGDIDFNVCRVQYDKKQELEEGVKNWAFYNNQVKTMQAIKAINPEIKFFGTMRSDYDGYGDDNNMPDWIHNYNTKVTDTQKYGVFLADYCEYMSNQGVPIAILSTAKEWMWHVRASEAEEIINTMYGELENRGIEKPMIIDQGFWSISAGLTYLKDVGNLGTKDMYTGFCSHNYANEYPEKWVEITEKAVALGKPMYDDETSTGSGSPTYGVEREMYKQIGEYIKKAQRYEAGLSGEVYFEIWSRGIDKETRSIYFPNKGKGKRLRGYYMMKHFSNNVLGYTYVTSTINEATDVYTITFRKDDEIVLWVINKGDNEYTLPIQMDKSTITSKVATHYWTDHTPVEGADTTYIASGNTFVPEIKGESMSCFIFDVTENEVDACSTLNTNLLEAECNDVMSGISLQESTEGTAYVTDINHGDWIAFNQVDFGNGQDQFAARVSSNTIGGNIEVRLNSVDGDLLGTLAVSNTLGTQNWTTLSTDIIETTGIQNIYLKFTGSGDQMFHVNWVGFQKEPAAINLETSSANSSVVLNWSLDNVTLGTQNLYRNTFFAEDGKTLIAENIKEYNYVDNNVSNGETYWYWLEVVDSENNTVKSNVLEITPSIPNLALASNGCIATQSTTGWSGFAELAIDGNTDGNFNNGSVTHTSADAVADPEPWWQVDLKKDYTINVIDIYNRTGNSYGDRLNNFTVEVKDKAGNVTYSQFYETQPDPPLLSIQVGGVLGSVVKISKTSNTALSLAEVQVYGDSSQLSNATFSNNKEIQVYPNPVANNFTITNCKDAALEFYTVLGTLVSKSNVDTNQQSVDISGFKKGVYFVKINQKGVTTQVKIIKN